MGGAGSFAGGVSVTRTGEPWRDELLTRFGRMLFAGGAPLLALAAASFSLRPQVLAACLLAVGSGAAAAVLPVLGSRVRGFLLVGSLVLVSLSSLATQGRITIASALALTAATVLAAVVFGARGGGLTLAGSAAWLIGFGAHASWSASGTFLSSSLPAWLQTIALHLLMTGLMVLLVSTSVRTMERALRQTQASLADAIGARLDRDRAEEALRANEERLRLALDAARMTTWEWDVASGEVSWSGPVHELVGLPPIGCRGTLDDIRRTVHPEDLPALEASIAEVLASKITEYQTEYRVRGTEPARWVEGRGRVYHDSSGRPVLMRGTAADVTARKRSEEALRDSEERWRRISEATSEGIAFSEQGVMTDVNEQLAAMLGHAREEILGRPVRDCVAAADRDTVAEAMRSGRTGTYEHRALRKDGSTFPVEVRGRSLTIEGRPVRVTAIRDLSERTRLEAELRRRETLAAMGALVAGVAHEVRTPLFSLSATIETLEARSGTPAQREELRSLLRSQVFRLSNLMQDLLDYGRVPRMRLASDWLATALSGALESCQAFAAHAGVRVAVHVPEGLPAIPSDAGRLQQVLQNLIANALQHSPRGSTVTVSAAAVDGPAPGLAFRVADEGPGISPQDLDRVFDPFFSRRRGGTGMGLSVAQRFVEAHGGTLTAANGVGGGAVFTVFLPAPRRVESAAPVG
jgi:PAS domain S-box-containing protein